MCGCHRSLELNGSQGAASGRAAMDRLERGLRFGHSLQFPNWTWIGSAWTAVPVKLINDCLTFAELVVVIN
jgi:hypothetical protein